MGGFLLSQNRTRTGPEHVLSISSSELPGLLTHADQSSFTSVLGLSKWDENEDGSGGGLGVFGAPG